MAITVCDICGPTKGKLVIAFTRDHEAVEVRSDDAWHILCGDCIGKALWAYFAAVEIADEPVL